ncbi:hypothetical protein IWQ61_004579 [Dispira simplex]|nr:hypothetical protein IWQ61_004579 [Dispira simplex]
MPQSAFPKPGSLRLACDECHRLKIKCSRGQPCEKCQIRGKPCHYSLITRRTPVTTRNTKKAPPPPLTTNHGVTPVELPTPKQQGPSTLLTHPSGITVAPTTYDAFSLLQKMDDITNRLLQASNQANDLTPAPITPAFSRSGSSPSISPPAGPTHPRLFPFSMGVAPSYGKIDHAQPTHEQNPEAAENPNLADAQLQHRLNQLGITYTELVAMLRAVHETAPPQFVNAAVRRFVIRLRLNLIGDLLLYTVLAMGARSLHSAFPTANSRYHTLDDRFFELAERHVQPTVEQSSLDNVTALLILAELTNMRELTNQALAYFSLSFNMGIALQLHLTKKPLAIDSSTTAAQTEDLVNPDHLLTEFRTRLWWELFSHETLAALALERMPALQVSETSCAFPSDDEVFHEALQRVWQDPRFEFDTSPVYPSMLPFSIHRFGNSLPFVQLVTFCSFAESHIYKRHAVPESLAESSIRLYNLFTEWWDDTMPTQFPLEPLAAIIRRQGPQDPATVRQLSQRLTIHIFYYTTVLCLFSIPKNCQSRLSKSTLEHCQFTRFRAVQSISRLLVLAFLVPPHYFHYIVPLAFTQAVYVYLDTLPGSNVTVYPISPALAKVVPPRGGGYVSPVGMQDFRGDIDPRVLGNLMSTSTSVTTEHFADQDFEAHSGDSEEQLLTTPSSLLASIQDPRFHTDLRYVVHLLLKALVRDDSVYLNEITQSGPQEGSPILNHPSTRALRVLTVASRHDTPAVTIVKIIGKYIQVLNRFSSSWSRVIVFVKDIRERLAALVD